MRYEPYWMTDPADIVSIMAIRLIGASYLLDWLDSEHGISRRILQR